MKTFKIILKTLGNEKILFQTNSLLNARKKYDEYLSKKGIKKGESLHIYSINKIKSINVFIY